MAGFTFGAASPPASAPSTGTSFSFGAPAAAASSASASAPAPATGGFAFGGTSTTNNATTATSSSSNTPAPSAPSSFSFGGSAAATSVSATNASAPSTSFSFGGSSTSSNAIVNTNGNSNAPSETTTASSKLFTIPRFEESFPNLAIHTKVEAMIQIIQDPETSVTDLTFLGQELEHLLSAESSIGKALSHPKPVPPVISGNAGLRSNLATVMKVKLPSKDEPTPLTQSILNTILHLSDALHIKEEDAAILYNSVILDSLDEDTLGVDTVEWFQKRYSKPTSIDGFVQYAVNKAQDDDAYVSRFGSSTDVSMKDDEDEEDVILSAMNLYFLEQGHILKTLLMLIQQRVSVSASYHATGELSDTDKIILTSTDRLLNQNLVINLSHLVKDLTLRNEEVAEKIRKALDQNGIRSSSDTAVGTHQTQTSGLFNSSTSNTSFGSGGLFGITSSVGTQPKTTSPLIEIHDADYCLYEFTYQQRYIACQCLFYLAYHTQLEMGEVTDLIDLLRDLTNGQNMGGFGGGLPILDPIRDIPDPYVLSWSDKKDSSANINQEFQGTISMTPQQRRSEKNEVEWRQELIKSLWSVKGLTQATVTTSTEFQGHEMFRATSLKSYGSSVEVIGSGKPQLMQCTGLLIMTIICALDTNSILMDRISHSPNSIGNGNVLLPLDKISSAHQTLMPIRERIDPDININSKWRRQDIEGLLSAAFGLLLRPATEVLSSPISGNSGPSQIKSIFKSCLEYPAICKSLTFARVSLIPCLGFPSDVSTAVNLDNDFSFLISVLSDFSSKYIDAICSFGQLPDSRAKWMHVETQELELSHVREQQRKQMNQWSGQEHKSEILPTEVDESKRPDCIDDMISLAITLCLSYPECPRFFWASVESVDENNMCVTRLDASRMLKKLEVAIVNDPSLISSYLSFLSAISLADPVDTDQSGAYLVYEWLCDNNRLSSSSSTYDSTKQLNWESILSSLHYYATQLNPAEESDEVALKVGEQYETAYNEESTSYYYGADDNGISNSRITSNESNTVSTSNQTARKQLKEADIYTLSAMISIISNISLKSPVHRRKILSIRIPEPGGKKFSTKENDILSILFSLSIAPISSDLRGLVLSTIANLVSLNGLGFLSDEEKEQADETILRCWELLEASQIIPILRLSQYAIAQGYQRSSEDVEKGNWFPLQEQNGIVYELEYVENLKGSYPATEGVLKLLTSLFSSKVQPVNLGELWRQQPGCTPYIEYVVDFVLPRALGIGSSNQGLYFSSFSNKYRLLTRALETVDSVLSLYVPIPKTHRHPNESQAIQENTAMPKYQTLDPNGKITKFDDVNEFSSFLDEGPFRIIKNAIIPSGIKEENQVESERDFREESLTWSIQNTNENQKTDQTAQNKIPRRKSPGFSILADFLSSHGLLLNIVLNVLSESEYFSLKEIERYSWTMSLYGETEPSFEVSRDGRDYLLIHQKKAVFDIGIKSLSPGLSKIFAQSSFVGSIEYLTENPLSDTIDTICTRNDTSLWRDACVLLSLRLLCEVGARYVLFDELITSNRTCMRYVPVLSFQRKNITVGNPLYVKTLQIIDFPKVISESFISQTGSRFSLLSLLSNFVGYQSHALSRGNILSLYAICLVKFSLSNIANVFRPGIDTRYRAQLASAFSNRLSLTPILRKDEDECLIGEEILDILLGSLYPRPKLKESFGHIILGLSHKSIDEYQSYLRSSSEGLPCELCEYQNALDIIIFLLSDINYVFNSDTAALASKCFEILYHLCNVNIDESESTHFFMKLSVMEKLRRGDFWRQQLHRFLVHSSTSESFLSRILSRSLSNVSSTPDYIVYSHILDCISWLLKGISLELHALMGVPLSGIGSNLYGKLTTTSPQPLKCNEMLTILMGDSSRVLLDVLRSFPSHLSSMSQDLLVTIPSRDLLNLASFSQFSLPYVERYFTKLYANLPVDDRMAKISAIISWCDRWNQYSSFLKATHHLAKSWSDVTSTLFSSCHEILFSTLQREGSLQSNVHASTDLLSAVLQRLHFVNENYNDPGETVSLSLVVLPIIEAIFGFSHVSNMVTQEQITDIISLCINCISSCKDAQSNLDRNREEIAVIVAGGLTVLIESDFVSTLDFTDLFCNDAFRATYLSAAKLLCTLSSPLDAPRGEAAVLETVGPIARSSLISMLHFIEAHDIRVDRRSNFVPDLFLSSSLSEASCLSAIIQNLATGDDDVAHLVEAIICCGGGTELLIMNGISESILSASNAYLVDVLYIRKDDFGSTKAEYPDFLYRHVSILTSMLNKDLPQHALHHIIQGASKFIEIHESTIATLLSTYPLHHELVYLFLQLLVSLESTINDHTGCPTMSNLLSETLMSTIDKKISMLAYHLSQYPFPAEYLPLLPNLLRESQTKRLQHVRSRITEIQTDKCWWNSVEEKDLTDDVPLQNPPTGLINSSFHINSFGSQAFHHWSLGKYRISLSAMECSQMCILYLLERVSDVDAPISLDILDLSLSLSRLCDIARAIEDRIVSSHEPDDGNIVLKMGSLGGLRSTPNQMLLEIQRLEKEVLLQCGMTVASSAIMMLDLIRTSLEISKRNIGIVGMAGVKEDAMHIQCALKYCQIDFSGIGCTRWLPEAAKADKISRMTAKALIDSTLQLLHL